MIDNSYSSTFLKINYESLSVDLFLIFQKGSTILYWKLLHHLGLGHVVLHVQKTLQCGNNNMFTGLQICETDIVVIVICKLGYKRFLSFVSC